MDETGFSQGELAKAVNDALEDAGERPTVGDRTVRTWLTGKTAWPHRAKREALEAVFGCTAEALGFIPPPSPEPPPEDPDVIRRRFVTAAGGTVAAVALPTSTRPQSVGTSDVIRLRNGIDTLTALDDRRGGHAALERAALAGAAEVTGMQDRATSQRIRQRLFAIAADYTATAAWSCIDARQLDRASGHLDRALSLAGLAQDPSQTVQVWNLRALLARQREEYGEAVAAAQAAQAVSICRRDPLYASLAHARTAIGYANVGDHRAALRSLGYAGDMLAKAEDRPRPSWIDFYGPAELHSLTAIAHDHLGAPAEAEAASYRALSTLPTSYRRNRALTTARLAIAQVHQGEPEQGCQTTEEVFRLMDGAPLPGRMRSLLGDFHRDLLTLTPGMAREWGDRYRTEWSIA